MCVLTNIHDPPREGNYRDEHGNVIKPGIVVDYNLTWGTFTIQIGWPIATQPATKHGSGQKKLFFHLLNLAIVNSYILLSSRGGKKISHRFSSHHYQRHAGTVWARATTIHACGKTSPSFYKHRKIGHSSQQRLAWPQHQAAALSCVFSEGCDANHAIEMCQV